jgi:hypothetical protein
VSEFDAIADELYGLRPDAFAAARDEQVRTARAAGQQPLARELSQLRRPTQSAWLLNLLWRDQRDVMEQFFEVAEGLSRAQAQASGTEMRSLNEQRRQLEAALIRRARALAEEAGVSVNASTEREAQETLAAALAQPDVADEIRTGRLVKPAAYAGFGTPIVAAPGVAGQRRQAESAGSDAQKEPARPAPQAKIDRIEALAAQRAQRIREQREAAERRVQEARQAVETAAEGLAEQGREETAAHRHEADLRAEIDQLRDRLRGLESEVTAAREAALTAGRRRIQAGKTHDASLKALERAEQDLAQTPESQTA